MEEIKRTTCKEMENRKGIVIFPFMQSKDSLMLINKSVKGKMRKRLVLTSFSCRHSDSS